MGKQSLGICLIASSYPRWDQDGNARFVRSIAEAQAELGHRIYVLAPFSPQVRPYDSPVQIRWFRYVLPARLGVMGHAAALENDRRLRSAALWQAPLFGLSLMIAIRRLVREEKIDLLHAHWAIPAGFISSWMSQLEGKPLYVSLHGSDMYLATSNALWGSMATRALRIAEGVSACSQPLADAAIRIGAPADRVRVIPWGADPAKFNPMASSAESRQRLGLPATVPIVLAAGRLVGKKGLELLVRAMPQVIISVPNARLVILGEGPQRVSLQHLCNELNLSDLVLMPGAVSWAAMADYFAASDVFVMPSVRDAKGNLDGLPTVILEAMAAGRPVIATRVAGIPLVVKDNETGILINESDVEQLNHALIRLLTSPEERLTMGRAGRMRIEKELNWPEVAKRFNRMYGDLL